MLIILVAGGNSHGLFPNVILFLHESEKYYGNTNIDPELWRILKTVFFVTDNFCIASLVGDSDFLFFFMTGGTAMQ